MDVSLNLFEAYQAILQRLVGKTIAIREESSIIHGHLLWRTNFRPHNIQLSDYILGADQGVLSKLLGPINLEMLIKKVKVVFEGVSAYKSLNSLQYFFGGDQDLKAPQIERTIELLRVIADYNKETSTLITAEILQKVRLKHINPIVWVLGDSASFRALAHQSTFFLPLFASYLTPAQ